MNSQLAAARSALLAGNWVAAEEGFRNALLLDPKSPTGTVRFGHALTEQSKLADAEAAYKAVLAIEPLNAAAHANLGVIYYRMGDLSKAADEYYEANELTRTTR